MNRLLRILEVARWAPSGDNSQPWRFEILSPEHLVVHAFTRKLGVYDLDGSAAEISVGALLETMRIAASAEGCAMRFECRSGAEGGDAALIDVWIEEAGDVRPDPLLPFVRERSVQRRPLRTERLGPASKAALESSLGRGFRVVWFESQRERLRMAWLAVRSAKIRLTIPEAYAVHCQVIEWGARYSADRIPDQALGADALSVRSMRWLLASWRRVQLMNRYFGGTLAPRLQLELLPGLRCAAHFAIVSAQAPSGIEDHLRAGAAAQRFWLTACSLGLQLQPQHTPIMFAAYARRGVRFTEVGQARARAGEVAAALEGILGPEHASKAVFLGRLGRGAAARARSLRLPLQELVLADQTRPPHLEGGRVTER